MYDLNLLPITIHQGQQQVASAGFKAAAAPRRAARSRAEDMLILSMAYNGDRRNAPGIQKDWLDHLIRDFFKTSGSVTSAMRTLIETVNLTLMEMNLKSGRENGTLVGAINLAAIHRRILYIAQSGPTHAFSLNQQGLEHYFDSSQIDRGMGLSRSPNIRYFQADIGQGSFFFTTNSPPDTWSEELLFLGGFPNLDQLRRRLLNQTPQEFRLDLAQITPGDGRIIIEKPTVLYDDFKEEPGDENVAERVQQGDPQAEPGENQLSETQRIFPTSAASQESQPDTKEEIAQDMADDQTPDESIQSGEGLPASQDLSEEEQQDGEQVDQQLTHEKPKLEGKLEEKKAEFAKKKLIAEPDKIKSRSIKGLAAFVAWWRETRERVSIFFRDLINRWMPGSLNGTLGLSRGTLLFISIAVPLVLVGIAAGVYFSRGRNLQYQQYFTQAQMAASTAEAAQDPNQSRDSWNQVLDYLDQAESYRETEQLIDLRAQAQDALNFLDGAVRLIYQPAIVGSLYSEINITNIISYGPDLYLLDSAGGRVIHAERGTQGYEVDPDFVCATGNYSGGRIETVVDMVSLPINNPYQAHILAIDEAGNVAFCGPGQNPVVQSLPNLGAGLTPIRSIAYDVNYLYVLIPSASAILVYRPTNGQFLDTPTDFFEDMEFAELPDLNSVVDIAVNGQDLYLLQGDGALINCTTSSLGGNPVSCQAPVGYIDGRPGKEEQIFNIPESDYSAILYTTPPDPSINILDTQSGDIYRFSVRFRLYERLRPDMGEYEVDSPVATAFTIGIDRIAFLAFGHQVFYAYVD